MNFKCDQNIELTEYSTTNNNVDISGGYSNDMTSNQNTTHSTNNNNTGIGREDP